MVYHGTFHKIAAAVLLILFSSMLQAQEQCPKRIAAIRDDVLLAELSEALMATYQQLGCRVRIVELPGRRGISSFNALQVDGELYRLKLVEKRYTRPAVSSSVPLAYINNALWLHPDPAVSRDLPIGYLLGVVYQEEYLKGKNGYAFHTPEKMYEAYRNGRISGFLASESSVVAQVKRMGLSRPLRGETINKIAIYHYLGAEYEPIMRQFSELISKNGVFQKIVDAAGKE